jgi:phosphoserine phosphatase RsbU/P
MPQVSLNNTFLEIEHVESGKIAMFGLTGGRLLIGRSSELPIQLDHDGVSRLHAALICDPYQRWWVHDLGSMNGTYVNGTAVTQRLLNPGDTIVIGPYRLTLRVRGDDAPASSPPLSQPTVAPRAEYADFARGTRKDQPSTVRLAPLHVQAQLSLQALSCSRALLRVEDRQVRLRTLCEYAVGEHFPGLWGAVVWLGRDGTFLPVYGPVGRSAGASALAAALRTVEVACAERLDSLLRDVGPHVIGRVAGSSTTLVACVLGLSQDGADLFFVELTPVCDPNEWKVLLALLAEGYAHAREFWESRGQFGSNAAVERELEMARRLQGSLIPRLPEMYGLDLAIGYQPSLWVGGDYADAVLMPDGRVLLTVADVCGKGLQAALVAASLHTLVHVLVEAGQSLAELVLHMNAYLSRFLPEDSFVTMVCVAIDPRTGDLECANLGHPPPLLIARDGSVRPLQYGQNVALGMMELRPRIDKFRVDSDEVLLLYTDGLTELEDVALTQLGKGSEPLGREFVKPPENELLPGMLTDCMQIISSMADAEIDAISSRISQSIRIQRDLLLASDDIAFLLARLKSEPEPVSVRSQTRRPVFGI